MQDKQKVTLYLPQGIHRQLKIRAAVDEESMSTLVEKAIEFYLKYPERFEEIEAATYGKTHQVLICPECDAAMVMREPTSRYLSIIFNLFPEQYIQLRRTANSMISWKTLLSKTIDFGKKFKAQNIAFNNPLKTVYDSLDKTNVQEFLGDDGQAWYIRGILLTSLKRYEEAISSFDMALKLNPDHQKAWYKKGMAYYAIDFYEMAIESFKKALELDPSDYLSWYSLGKSWLELEADEKAMECFNKSLEINRDFELAKIAKMKDKQKITLKAGKTHRVHILPECDAALIMREGEMVSLKHQPSVVVEEMPLEIHNTTQKPDLCELEIIVL